MFFNNLQQQSQLTHVITLIFQIYEHVANEDNDKWIWVIQKTLFIMSINAIRALVKPKNITKNI